MAARVDAAGGTSSARRRRERHLRSMLRHERMAVAMALAEALHHSSGLKVMERAQHAAQRGQETGTRAGVAGPAPVTEYMAPAPGVFDAAPAPATYHEAFPRVVGSLPPGEVFAAPMFIQVHQEPFAAGEIPENMVVFPVVQEQVIVQAIPRVVGSHPPVSEFAGPVYDQVYQEQSSAGETTANIANIPVVQEQVLVQALPRLVGSLPPVDGFTAHVARRPLPLVEVRPSVRAQRHIVEDLGELAPLVQFLDLPVPQTVDFVKDVLRLLDRPLAEQAISLCPRSLAPRVLRALEFLSRSQRNSWWKCRPC